MRFVCVVLLWSGMLAWGQSQLGTGAISGTIQDPSGSGVAAAAITVTNAETGMVRQVTSSAAGQFLVPVLPPGRYQVRIVKPGFVALQEDAVIVNVGGTAEIPAVLKVGAITDTVNVEAQAPIDATQTDVSSLVDRNEISDLPINGRRYYDFALLTPGVARDGRFGLLSFRGASGNFANYM